MNPDIKIMCDLIKETAVLLGRTTDVSNVQISLAMIRCISAISLLKSLGSFSAKTTVLATVLLDAFDEQDAVSRWPEVHSLTSSALLKLLDIWNRK